ncbi:MAG TPA: hypothetical protein VFL42_02625 [Terriglobales bacterium]|nr:hypothetical protein [Terriglobales bacterium]
MHVPPEYVSWIAKLGFREISFGSGGIKLYTPEELDDAQIGYSRSAEGKSFCDGTTGSWNAEWIAIAYDTGLGDLIILDTSISELPVMTALHGEGSWDAKIIAGSLAGFGEALREVQRASVGRESPVALEQNPLPEDQRRDILARIRIAIGQRADIDFWGGLLETEEE